MTHEEHIWRALRSLAVSGKDLLRGIGPKPRPGERHFTVTFADGCKIRVSMERLTPLGKPDSEDA